MKINFAIGLLLLAVLTRCSPKLGLRDSKNVNWELYNETSIVNKDDITQNNLQGLWKAYEASFRFGDIVNQMDFCQPLVVEFRYGTYRRSLTDKFHFFAINDNVITCADRDKIEIGFINQIGPNDLIISWKFGSNYTGYYYKKYY